MRAIRGIVVLALLAWSASAQTVENFQKLPRGVGWYGGKPVQFKISEGMAVVEGDMILGPVEEILRAPGKDRSRADIALDDPKRRWPGGVVVYEIDPALANKERVTNAIAEWEAKTPIRFKPRSGEAGYVLIRRAGGGGTCSAHVGYLGFASVINLGDQCSAGNTIHEVGHAIGLFHTQSRTDRNNFLRVLYDNIDKENFDQYDQKLTQGADFGPYDYSSIMHYTTESFARNFGMVQVTVPLGIPIGQRAGLSIGDIQTVRKAYGQTIDEVVVSTNPPGLSITVDGESFTSPKSFPWKKGETHTISAAATASTSSPNTELRFARWSDSGDASRTITVDEKTNYYLANYSQFFRVQTSVSPAAAGSVVIVPDSPDGFYPYGSVLRIAATANGAQNFYRWTPGAGGATYLESDGQGNGANPVLLTVRGNDSAYNAEFTAAPITTIASNFPGARVTVDGTSGLTPRNVVWAAGSSHTLATGASQDVGGTAVRYQFKDWSNGGAASQSVTAGSAAATITANYTRRFQVSWDINYLWNGMGTPVNADSVVLSPSSPDGYYDEGTEISFTANGTSDLPFTNWYGDLSGTAATQKRILTEQLYVVGSFISKPFTYDRGLLNFASQYPVPASPGGLMTMMTPGIATAAEDIPAGPDGLFPTTYKGMEVKFDGTAARLFRVTKDSITIIPPFNLDGKNKVLASIQANNLIVTDIPMPVAPAWPGLFTVDPNGGGQIIAANFDGSMNSKDNPADRVSPIAFGITGIGKLEGQTDSGPVTGDVKPTVQLTAEVGGVPTQVVGLQSAASLALGAPGVYLITILIPPDAPVGPAVPIGVYAASNRSQFSATIAVK